MFTQVLDSEGAADTLLSDLPAFKTFSTTTHELIEELSAYARELFNSWSRDVLEAVDSPTEPLG